MIIFIHPCEFLYNMYLKMELLGHKICKSQLYQMLPKCFPKLLKQFRTLLENTEGFHCSTSSPSLVSSGFLIFLVLLAVLITVLICISLITCEIELLFLMFISYLDFLFSELLIYKYTYIYSLSVLCITDIQLGFSLL